MLKSSEFKQKWRCFKEGEIFNFNSGINLIVGDQGTGKSSLLLELSKGNNSKLLKNTTTNAIKLMYFDHEKMNPHIPKGKLPEKLPMFHVASIFSSHGQVINALNNVLGQHKNILFIIDEPDMALSPRSIYKLFNKMKEAEANGCQVIASVHNPILIQSVPVVLSLEHRDWIPSEEFLELHKIT